MIEFSVNGKERALDIEPDMPLLWVLRDELGLKWGRRLREGSEGLLPDGELLRETEHV